MIRATITAHIPDAALSTLTYQLNDRSVGALAPQRQANYVMTGARRVQMAVLLSTARRDADVVLGDRLRLRQWEHMFRRMQTLGLSGLRELVDEVAATCHALVVCDARRLLAFLPDTIGLYLFRQNRLVRIQPIEPTADSVVFEGLDLYHIALDESDSVLCVDPKFIDLFDAHELIDTWVALRHAAAVMGKLTDMASTYGDEECGSWLSLSVQHIARDQAVRPLSRQERLSFPHALPYSKAIRLERGNLYMPVARRAEAKCRPTPSLVSPVKVRLSTACAHPSGRRTLEEAERNASRLDRLKVRDMTPWCETRRTLLTRLTHIIPDQPLLSRALFVALVLVALIIVVAGGRAVLSRRHAHDTLSGGHIVVASNGSVVPTDAGLMYEIDWTIKAQSVTVYSQPGKGEAIASLTKGDKIVKLSEPKDDWVKIRLLDGREGYVYAAMVSP